MNRVLVLGSKGMLGHMVLQHLQQDPQLDVAGWTRGDPMPSAYDYIVNCIGAIPQKKPTAKHYAEANVQLPQMLARTNAHVIHVSSDCVFDGSRGNRLETDIPDALDAYGFSKALGENPNLMVIRTSLIGPELSTHFGLLEWARSNAGGQVNGYTDHLWNGVTTLQFAKCCQRIIHDGLWQRGVYHVFGDTLDKCALLGEISARYGLGLRIVPTESPKKTDRTLSTVHGLNAAMNIPGLTQMLAELP